MIEQEQRSSGGGRAGEVGGDGLAAVEEEEAHGERRQVEVHEAEDVVPDGRAEAHAHVEAEDPLDHRAALPVVGTDPRDDRARAQDRPEQTVQHVGAYGQRHRVTRAAVPGSRRWRRRGRDGRRWRLARREGDDG